MVTQKQANQVGKPNSGVAQSLTASFERKHLLERNKRLAFTFSLVAGFAMATTNCPLPSPATC